MVSVHVPGTLHTYGVRKHGGRIPKASLKATASHAVFRLGSNKKRPWGKAKNYKKWVPPNSVYRYNFCNFYNFSTSSVNVSALPILPCHCGFRDIFEDLLSLYRLYYYLLYKNTVIPMHDPRGTLENAE